MAPRASTRHLTQIPQLFHRIIASASQKNRYSYRLSFQNEVGSSIDPDMEDIATWERLLHGMTARSHPSKGSLMAQRVY
jgi:hypothetical protein